jgi:hypothetical protein
MDGKTLTRMLAEVLNENPDTSGFVGEGSRQAYDYLWQAAIEFNNRTQVLHTSQDITTVADQQNYALNADHQKLFAKDGYKRFFIKYTDGNSNVSSITIKPYEDILYAGLTSSIAVPAHFCVRDRTLSTATRTGASRKATSDGDASAGQCTLTDSNATFQTWDVQAGDTIHNTTDQSTGYVLSVTSETALVCALFDGTDNEWDTNDFYTIVHQPRVELYLEQPTSTASETITVQYVQRPAPVYSDYGTYRFQMQYAPALCRYAAWLMKYRDKDPNTGDSWYAYFDRMVNQANMVSRGTFGRRGYSVSLKKG